MNLIEAIKSGKPFRRPRDAPGWKFKDQIYSFEHDDILADDWEIQEPTVTITRTQFLNAAGFVREEDRWRFIGDGCPEKAIRNLSRKLGLEAP